MSKKTKATHFHLHFDCRALKRYQQNYRRFYIFSFAIYVRNMDMIDQVALHINNNNIESIKKLNLGL